MPKTAQPVPAVRRRPRQIPDEGSSDITTALRKSVAQFNRPVGGALTLGHNTMQLLLRSRQSNALKVQSRPKAEANASGKTA